MHNNAFRCHDMCDMQHNAKMQKMCMGKNHTHFWARTTTHPRQPSAGGWLPRIRPGLLAAPDTSAGGFALAPRATTPLFWMAGVVISQPSRWNAWSGYSKLSHAPADGCDGCMPAIMRPGGWPGHSHRSHRPEDGCAGWMAAKMACAGRAEWLGSCNCSHVSQPSGRSVWLRSRHASHP